MRNKMLLVVGLLCVSAVAFGGDKKQIETQLDPNKIFLGYEDFSDYVVQNIKNRHDSYNNVANPWNKASENFAEDYTDILLRKDLSREIDRMSIDAFNIKHTDPKDIKKANDEKILLKAFSDVANLWTESLDLRGNKNKKDSRNARIFENRLLLTENTRAILRANDRIDENEEAIEKNKKEIDENKVDIAINKEAIDKNKDDIAINKYGIAENAKAIADTNKTIEATHEVLLEDIMNNEEAIAKNAKDIATMDATNQLKFKELEHGVAMVAAMSSLDTTSSAVGKTKISAAVGGHGTDFAVALGIGRKFNDSLSVNAKLSTSTNSLKKLSYSAGISYEF